MTRKILATIVAAALAVTSVNIGTAQAGNREVTRLIVGATALAIIGSAIAAEQRNKQAQGTHYKPQPQYRPQPQYGKPHHHGNKRHDNRWNDRKNYRPVVARDCLMSVRGSAGWTQGYALDCARNTTRATLPSDCVRRNYAQGPRLFYSPQCLRQKGFNA